MLEQLQGDSWIIKDRDKESQHNGRNFHFNFSTITSDEMRSVVKDYVWQNHRTGNLTLRSLYDKVNQFIHFNSFANLHGISSFRSLTNTDMDLFMSYLRTIISSKTNRPLTYRTQKGYFVILKQIIYWGQRYRPDDFPMQEIFTGNEYPGINKRIRVEFIPDDILAQINAALLTEANPYIKYGIIILQCTGMRIGDLLMLKTDCVHPHPISGHTIQWFDHKNRKQRAPMPVRNECVVAVNQLLEVTSTM